MEQIREWQEAIQALKEERGYWRDVGTDPRSTQARKRQARRQVRNCSDRIRTIERRIKQLESTLCHQTT